MLPEFIYFLALLQYHLIDVVEGGALIRPVSLRLFLPILYQSRHHHNHRAAVLPNHLQTGREDGVPVYHQGNRDETGGDWKTCRTHLPEISHCVSHRPLCGDVSWLPGVMVKLGKRAKRVIYCDKSANQKSN